MMDQKQLWRSLSRLTVAVLASTLLAINCTPGNVREILPGLDVTVSFEEENDDVSFMDWLHSEIDDW